MMTKSRHLEIAELIPHAGTMCLLDAVIRWDATSIVCRAASHRDRNNPLARNGRLAAICGIEYASQAMALHGRLASGGAHRPTAGYLASVRDVTCHTARLDDLPGDLVVKAECLHADGGGAIYGFAIHSDEQPIIEGRAAVVLHARPPA